MENSSRSSRFFVDGIISDYRYPPPSVFLDAGGVYATTMTKQSREQLVQHVFSSYVDYNRTIDWDEVAISMNTIMSQSGCIVRELTVMDCYAAWTNTLDSSIKKGSWVASEEKQLLKLAHEHDEHYWCTIADELNTQRTPFDCLQHYQQALNANLLLTENWSEEEDEQLRVAVQANRAGSLHRQWQLIAESLPGRSADQCLYRWRRSMLCQADKVDGKWLEDEERVLFAAALILRLPTCGGAYKGIDELQALLSDAPLTSAAAAPRGDVGAVSQPDWSVLSRLIPSKNEIQCREKWMNSLDPSINKGPYSKAEDQLLLEVVAALIRRRSLLLSCSGPHPPAAAPVVSDEPVDVSWAAVAGYMKGRTDSSVRSRYRTLVKGMDRDSTRSVDTAIARKKRVLPSLSKRSIKSKLRKTDFQSVLRVTATVGTVDDV